MSKAEHQAQQQVTAAKLLKENLGKLAEDDPDLLADMIEGETDLFEMIDRVLVEIEETDLLLDGISTREKDLSARKKQISDRKQRLRVLIEQAMDVGEIKTLQRPLATVTLSLRKPEVEITEEGDIPTAFWVASKPRLDRKGLREALESGEAIPGATLGNAAPSITIRRK